MALVQTFPKFECVLVKPAVNIVPEEDEGYYLPYKRNGNIERVISIIRVHRHVLLDAAPASGKTTALPISLASSTGELVILVLPYEHLAAVVHNYLSGINAGMEIHHLSSVGLPIPQSGLVVTSAGCLAARWLQAGEVSLPRCYVLHDESHESGAATALLRMLGPKLRGVLSYVRMSATSEADGFRRMESAGRLIIRTYSRDQFSDPWSVGDVGAPWSLVALTGNILIFEDDPVRSNKLIQAYAAGGVPTFRWHSRMSVSTLLADLALLRTTEDRFHAIIADSSFRSGYTLPVGTIVDSGFVRRVTVDNAGRPEWTSREIYEGESVQTASRGGRMDGQVSVYWSPIARYKKRVALLEQTDVEALAVMLTVLGYRLPEFLLTTRAAKGNLPLDIPSTFEGDMPIASLTEDSMCSVTDYNKLHLKPESKPGEGLGTKAPQVMSGDWMDEMQENLKGLSMAGEALEGRKRKVPKFGLYVVALDLLDVTHSMSLFPAGVASVYRMATQDDTSFVVSTWDPVTRSEALRLLLNRYNSIVVQMRGGAQAMSAVKAESAGRSPQVIRKWAMTIAEGMSQMTIESQRAYKLAIVLAGDIYTLEEGTFDMSEDEAMFKSCYLRDFKKLPKSRVATKPEIETRHLRSISESSSSSVGSEGAKTVLKHPKLVSWIAGRPYNAKNLREGSIKSSSSSSGRST